MIAGCDAVERFTTGVSGWIVIQGGLIVCFNTIPYRCKIKQHDTHQNGMTNSGMEMCMRK